MKPKPPRRQERQEKIWLGLMVGNSRLHWAWFVDETLKCAWDTDYLPTSVLENLEKCGNLGDLLAPYVTGFPASLSKSIPLYLASVVPSQTVLWQTYPNVHVITLDQVPLSGVYPTLGIDRALALWGAGESWEWPVLVIDAGTALTLTGADADRRLVGGAILPGVRLQLQSLARTAALPLVDIMSLPPRWSLNTPDAIQSGVIYTIISGLRDFIEAWWRDFPGSSIVFTGGDHTLLLKYLQLQCPEIARGVFADRHLIFWGMRSCRN